MFVLETATCAVRSISTRTNSDDPEDVGVEDAIVDLSTASFSIETSDVRSTPAFAGSRDM